MNYTLYICATPIGNLSDVSSRVIETLNSCDIIACEDTRHTIKLLNHFSIKKKLISYHQHNEQSSSDFLITLLNEGKNVALVSDAGMPCISDPGFLIIQKAIKNNIKVIPIAGPSAFLLAIAASGFNTDSFIFEGFINKDKIKKTRFLKSLENEFRTMVIYESPHNLLKTLKEINDICPERNICIARELTKKFEEIWHGTVSNGFSKFSVEKPQGEFCIVIEGKNLDDIQIDPENLEHEINKKILELSLKGLSKKDVSKLIAKEFNVSSKEIYSKLVQET
ncbi:MAG: 16S rRNA (cytidine(1402)-2'-O)-methyltransferase [Candidatus Sericytochromatia bacterium]